MQYNSIILDLEERGAVMVGHCLTIIMVTLLHLSTLTEDDNGLELALAVSQKSPIFGPNERSTLAADPCTKAATT